MEMLVSLFIVVLLMGVGLHEYRLYHARSASLGAAQILAQDLKSSGSRALANQRTTGLTVISPIQYRLWECNPYCVCTNQLDCTGCTVSPTCTAPPSPLTTGQIPTKSVLLNQLFPIPVQLVSSPGTTVRFYPQSTRQPTIGSRIWSPLTVSPSGTYVLQSANVTRQVTIDANGQITSR